MFLDANSMGVDTIENNLVSELFLTEAFPYLKITLMIEL